MKRIASLILALTLCAGLAVPAWAEEVTGPPENLEQSGTPTSTADLVTNPAPAQAADFSDVPTASAHYEGIMYCAEHDIVSGYSATLFGIGDSVTRAQFATMLCRGFYPDELAQYQTAENKAIGAHMPAIKALNSLGMFKNTSFASICTNYAIMGTQITRYDMAVMMTNIMSAKGFSATEAQKSTIQSSITDYKSIPSNYQDAVKNVYALGVITGDKYGNFNGNDKMTRGAGATVIYRMCKYAPTAETPTTPSNPSDTGNTGTTSGTSTPSTPPTGTSIITVSNFKDNRGDTAWTVSDNNYPTGYLNNGKPITQENVLALLNAAKVQWPDGMTWDDYGATGNSVYSGAGTVTTNCIARDNKVDTYAGCGGFAAMLSDYIFGKSNNPVHKLDDNTKVRPGDIIVSMKNGVVTHISIAIETVSKTATGKPGVDTANGNSGGTVQWYNSGDNYGATGISNMTNVAIYTRYPD